MINLSNREKALIKEIYAKNTKLNKKNQQEQGSQKLISQSSKKILVSKLERKLNEVFQYNNNINYKKLMIKKIMEMLIFNNQEDYLHNQTLFQTASYNYDYQLETQSLNNPMQKQQEEDLHQKEFEIISNLEEKADMQAAFCLFRIILDPNQLNKLCQQKNVQRRFMIKKLIMNQYQNCVLNFKFQDRLFKSIISIKFD